jgi:mRNA interferase MazF
VAALPGDDVILCQITSQAVRDQYALALTSADFATGSLHHDSNLRPNRIFTADSRIVLYRAGSLRPAKMQAAVDAIVQILRA